MLLKEGNGSANRPAPIRSMFAIFWYDEMPASWLKSYDTALRAWRSQRDLRISQHTLREGATPRDTDVGRARDRCLRSVGHSENHRYAMSADVTPALLTSWYAISYGSIVDKGIPKQARDIRVWALHELGSQVQRFRVKGSFSDHFTFHNCSLVKLDTINIACLLNFNRLPPRQTCPLFAHNLPVPPTWISVRINLALPHLRAAIR